MGRPSFRAAETLTRLSKAFGSHSSHPYLTTVPPLNLGDRPSACI